MKVVNSCPTQLADAWVNSFGSSFNHYKSESQRTKLLALLGDDEISVEKSDCWNQNNVQLAIANLALNKASGHDSIPSELYYYAPVSISTHLSLFFRACEVHHHLPSEMAEGTIHPVPKAGKDQTKLDNYRPITIACSLAKIFESCVLLEYSKNLQSSHLQFGFKKNVGTRICTLSLKTVAKFFVNRGSRVFAATLDAKSAFDRANFHQILSLMLLRGVPRSVVRLLLTWYEQTMMRVMYNKCFSQNSFKVSHGVKQGGISSPILFALLIDTLLTKLQLSGVGCRIGSNYFGAVAYADDVVLMAPSINALNILLSECSKWSKKSYLTFNSSKSFVICFANRNSKWPEGVNIPAYLEGKLLPSCTEITHLGHTITWDLADSAEVTRIGKAFNRQFHAFYSRFSLIKNSGTVINIFKSYCQSFYGIEYLFLNNINKSSIKFLKKSVNLAMMRLLSLPRESASLYLIAHFKCRITMGLSVVQFWSSLMTSHHPFAKFILKLNNVEISKQCKTYKLLPYSLPALSSNYIHQIVVAKWLYDKDFFSDISTGSFTASII